VLHPEAKVNELIHTEHPIGIKAMLIAAGMELHAHLPQLRG
jgi:hypothetical protein